MADARWLRIQKLVETADGWPAHERALRLQDFEPDPGLRQEALSLIDAMERESRAAASTARVPQLPHRIGPWQILRVAGEGGRGTVYQAQRNGQYAAVKVLRDDLSTPASLERFEREQRLLGSLKHPGIATLLEAGWDGARPYLAMEWIDGEPIDQYCHRNHLSRRARVQLMIPVLEALGAAHAALIAHLDLKPANLLASGGLIKIVDFGTAKLVPRQNETTTQQLTPRYASPEQLRGEPVTIACDIYAAGLTLHEMLTGNPIFGDGGWAALAERAQGQARARIATGDRDLDAIVAKAVEFEPSRRYASAAAMASDLQAYLQTRPVLARRGSWGYRAARWIRRNRAFVAAAALIAAVAAWGAIEQQRRLIEAGKARETGRFLRGLMVSSAVPGSGKGPMTVADLAAAGSRRVERSALDPALGASLLSDFAFVLREAGREDEAEPIARRALERARQSGDAAAQLRTRVTLAEIAKRRGGCAEAQVLLREGEPLLDQAQPGVQAEFALARGNTAELCQGKPEEARQWIERALGYLAAARPDEFAIPKALVEASARLQGALTLSRLGRYDEARAMASQGLHQAESVPEGAYFRVALLRVRSQVESAAGRPAEALRDIRQATELAPGVVAPFEAVRLQTLTASRLVEAGDKAEASAAARSAVQEARTRRAEIGPSFWMILADAAEAHAKAGSCPETVALYEEVNRETKGQLRRDWKGNQLFYLAECAAASDPRRAQELARQAREVYGDLLAPNSKRASRLRELAGR